MTAADYAERLSRYRLESALDGFSDAVSVWSAVDAKLQRPVTVAAIDLTPSTGDPPETRRAHVVERLRRAAQLTSSEILATFDIVEAQDVVYVVAESVDAQSLRARVREVGLLSVAETCDLAAHLLHAISEAHARDLVHGRITPSTVFLFDDASVKLAGFGWRSDTSTARANDDGYVAPEVAAGCPPDRTADLWGLGAVLHFARRGTSPRVARRAAPMTTGPASLETLIATLLDDVPERRPDANRAQAMLKSINRRPQPRPLTAAPATAENPAVTPARPTTATRQSSWRNKLIAAAISIAVLSVVAAGVVAWRSAGDSSAGDAPATEGSPSETSVPATSELVPSSVSTTSATTSPPTSLAAPPTTIATPASAVPRGWTLYTDRVSGYRIARPDGWAVRAVTPYRTDFVDPASNAFVRVEWTDEPGPDPVEAWRAQARSFAARQTGYEELRIEPSVFKGHRAAEWEFRYTDRGAARHALDIGMVTGRYGAALFAVGAETDWPHVSRLLDTFRSTFEPPV